MTERVKLEDVARRAGVSTATASRVLNGNTSVDQELAERVKRASGELGYRKNTLARGLRRRTNNVIGIVIPDITNPFFTDLVRAVEDVVQEQGYLLVLCSTDEKADKEFLYINMLVDQQVAGVIIAPVEEATGTHLTRELGGTPTVTVDRLATGAHVDNVTLDNAAGARALTAYLLSKTSEVAIIAGPKHTTTGRERLLGFHEALVDAAVVARPEWIVISDFSESGGYEAATKLLTHEHPPGAIFSSNNAMTIGVLRALNDLQRPPGAVHIASFGPVPWSVDPAHVVVSLMVPTYEMGQRAARMLVERIDGSTHPVRSVALDPGPITIPSRTTNLGSGAADHNEPMRNLDTAKNLPPVR